MVVSSVMVDMANLLSQMALLMLMPVDIMVVQKPASEVLLVLVKEPLGILPLSLVLALALLVQVVVLVLVVTQVVRQKKPRILPRQLTGLKLKLTALSVRLNTSTVSCQVPIRVGVLEIVHWLLRYQRLQKKSRYNINRLIMPIRDISQRLIRSACLITIKSLYKTAL